MSGSNTLTPFLRFLPVEQQVVVLRRLWQTPLKLIRDDHTGVEQEFPTLEEEGSLDPAGMPSQRIFDDIDLRPRRERKLGLVGLGYAVVSADPNAAVPQHHGPHI